VIVSQELAAALNHAAPRGAAARLKPALGAKDAEDEDSDEERKDAKTAKAEADRRARWHQSSLPPSAAMTVQRKKKSCNFCGILGCMVSCIRSRTGLFTEVGRWGAGVRRPLHAPFTVHVEWSRRCCFHRERGTYSAFERSK
jgi:hypothetical protein